jgi:hypothetical protein
VYVDVDDLDSDILENSSECKDIVPYNTKILINSFEQKCSSDTSSSNKISFFKLKNETGNDIYYHIFFIIIFILIFLYGIYNFFPL